MIRRFGISLCLMAGALSWCASVEGGRRSFSPRYRSSSHAEIVVRPGPAGRTTVKETYRGNAAGFPVPSWLYYGYPHSGDGTVGGVGAIMGGGVPF